MLSVSMLEDEEVRITVPTTGKSKSGKTAKLEGPPSINVDPGSEDVATATLDPKDPTGNTVLVTSIVSETTNGDGPWLITGSIGKDARIGPDVSEITSLFSIEIRATDAIGFDLVAGAPTKKA